MNFTADQQRHINRRCLRNWVNKAVNQRKQMGFYYAFTGSYLVNRSHIKYHLEHIRIAQDKEIK